MATLAYTGGSGGMAVTYTVIHADEAMLTNDTSDTQPIHIPSCWPVPNGARYYGTDGVWYDNDYVALPNPVSNPIKFGRHVSEQVIPDVPRILGPKSLIAAQAVRAARPGRQRGWSGRNFRRDA